MHVYTATIGRNITAAHPTRAHQPLTLTEWEQFVEDVKTDMGNALRTAEPLVLITETHYGAGAWQGVVEESCKVTMLAEFDAGRDLAPMLAELRGHLTENARQYGQDAIALTIGESELC